MPLHAYMQTAEAVRQHVERFGTDLDGRTLEILREAVDHDLAHFLPVLDIFRKQAQDLVPEAEEELARIRNLRASLEP